MCPPASEFYLKHRSPPFQGGYQIRGRVSRLSKIVMRTFSSYNIDLIPKPVYQVPPHGKSGSVYQFAIGITDWWITPEVICVTWV